MLKLPRIPIEQIPDSAGLEYEDISFPSRVDGIILRGWYLAGNKDLSLIIINGGAQNRVDIVTGTLEICRDLVERGYGMLLFDLRGRGESEGTGRHLVHSTRDIGGAVDYLLGRFPSKDIGLIGFSTGAAAAVIFASRNNISAVIADNCFTSITDSLSKKLAIEQRIPQIITKVIAPGLYLLARVLYGYKKIDPVSRVTDVSCPVLFIHGDSDDLTSVFDTNKLYKASDNPLDEVWIVPGAGHTQAYHTDPTGYIERVTRFLDKIE